MRNMEELKETQYAKNPIKGREVELGKERAGGASRTQIVKGKEFNHS